MISVEQTLRSQYSDPRARRCPRNKWCKRLIKHRGRCSRKSNDHAVQLARYAINSTYGKGAGSMAAYFGGRVEVQSPQSQLIDIALHIGVDRAETVLKRVRQAARELTA